MVCDFMSAPAEVRVHPMYQAVVLQALECHPHFQKTVGTWMFSWERGMCYVRLPSRKVICAHSDMRVVAEALFKQLDKGGNE